VRKRAIDMHRIKHASERFMATLQTDHRYMALAFCDILKIIISLILLSSADYLSL
jgi:ABC-type siderophore export system fused ATPase/permease subunit